MDEVLGAVSTAMVIWQQLKETGEEVIMAYFKILF